MSRPLPSPLLRRLRLCRLLWSFFLLFKVPWSSVPLEDPVAPPRIAGRSTTPLSWCCVWALTGLTGVKATASSSASSPNCTQQSDCGFLKKNMKELPRVRICSLNNAPNHKTMLSIQTQLVFQTGRYRFQDLAVCVVMPSVPLCLRSMWHNTCCWVGVCPCARMSSFLKWCLFHFHKGSGNSFSPLPASLFEHASIGQANNRTTQRTTQHCEVRALMPLSTVYPPHVCHRQGTGQSPTARTCSRTRATLQRLHVSAICLCVTWLDCWTQRPGFEKIGDNFPGGCGKRCRCPKAYVSPRRAVRINKKKKRLFQSLTVWTLSTVTRAPYRHGSGR